MVVWLSSHAQLHRCRDQAGTGLDFTGAGLPNKYNEVMGRQESWGHI